MILKTRRNLDYDQFLTRFDGDVDAMEEILRVALVQGITARTKITRRHLWRFYNGNLLGEPIPDFGTAYEFYQRLDAAKTNVPGFFFLPAEKDREAEWVPLEVRLTPFYLFLFFSFRPLLNLLTEVKFLQDDDFEFDMDTEGNAKGVAIGPNRHRVYRRLWREYNGRELGPEDDEELLPDDGHAEAPRVKAAGLFAEVLRGGLTPFDLEAVEATEESIAAEEFDEETEEEEDGGSDGEEASGSESSDDSDSDAPLSSRKAEQRRKGKSPPYSRPFLPVSKFSFHSQRRLPPVPSPPSNLLPTRRTVQSPLTASSGWRLKPHHKSETAGVVSFLFIILNATRIHTLYFYRRPLP